MSTLSRSAILTLSFLIALCPAVAGAWGLQGHAIIGRVATDRLPSELPAFVRTQAAKDEITYLQSEEDRLKIGETDELAWTREWTTDHYLDITDDGKIGGVVSLNALPSTRDGYEQALMRAPQAQDAYKLGFLPYAILEGYEQVRSDFALWRLAKRSRPEEVQYCGRLTIHDIGIFSPFVGDASQPLHVTVHYNGWGNYPNPRGFSMDRTIHRQFEDDWVDRYESAQQAAAFFHAPTVLSTIPLVEIERYLQTSKSFVVPFYELQARGGFAMSDNSSAAHRAELRFTASRLAAASEMLDSLILTAWRTSAGMRAAD